MNLYVLRHGIAAERGAPGFNTDADRPLIAKGRRQLGQIAVAMKKMGLDFDLILSSPFLRARQTAEIVAQSLKLKKRLALADALTPDGDPKLLIRQLIGLKPEPANILLVGHEPYLSRLVALLVLGEDGAGVELKKGGLCKMVTGPVRPGRCATLTWLLTPKQMKLMN